MESALAAEKSSGGDDNEAENVNLLAKSFWGGGGAKTRSSSPESCSQLKQLKLLAALPVFRVQSVFVAFFQASFSRGCMLLTGP